MNAADADAVLNQKEPHFIDGSKVNVLPKYLQGIRFDKPSILQEIFCIKHIFLSFI